MRFKVIAGFHLPWDVPTMAFATGSGAILASLWTIQPLWLMLAVAVLFDFLLGAAAAQREDKLSIKTAEGRALTNAVILGSAKFFYFLSDNAEHFKSVHGAAAASITDAYPIGDVAAYALMILLCRSIVGSMGVFGIKIPYLTDWLDSAAAKSPTLPPIPSEPNVARAGPLTQPEA